MSDADLLRRAADALSGTPCALCQHPLREHTIGHPYVGCVARGCDCGGYAPLVAWQVAARLAAWLRAEAVEHEGEDGCPGTVCSASVAFARALLGDTGGAT